MRKKIRKAAIISDIHGNFPALEGVLSDIEKEKVDSIICLGDVATLGPQPNDVINKLKSMDCCFVLGNHDEALLFPDRSNDLKIPMPLISSLDWCKQQLDQEDIDFLGSFSSTYTLSLGKNESLLCYHGSPLSNTKNILATTPDGEMDTLFKKYDSTFFAGGHTHIQMLKQHNGRLFINPGSVGMPFHHTPAIGEEPDLLPFAEYLILFSFENNIKIDLRRISFDIGKYKKAIKRSTLPIKEWLFNKYN